MRYPKGLVLKDGVEAVIRPLEKNDEEALRLFYAGLSDNDRWYMRYDTLDPEVIGKWIKRVGRPDVYSTIAVSSDKIIGHASLHTRGFGATRHVGRLRITVAPEFRHKRLGTWMLLDLIQLAMDMGLETLRSDFVVGVEDAAIEAAYKLDFFKEAVLKDYVKDQRGFKYDIQIMVKRLHKDWGDF